MPDLRQEIQDLLNQPNLVEALPRMFCELLNWGAPHGSAVSVKLAAQTAANGEIRLTLTPVAQLSGMPVFYTRWPGDRLPGVVQRREVHKKLSPSFLEHLIVYETKESRHLAFVWARNRKDGQTEIRTLPYQPGKPARTTLDRLAELEFSINELGLLGDPGITRVTEKLNAAFDVEAVTKQFFALYRQLFKDLEDSLPLDPELTPEKRRLFTQKFFNRLMFLMFLERKGWLSFKGEHDYLRALFLDYGKSALEGRTRGTNFHRSRLDTLFFLTLNNRYGQNKNNDPEYKIFHDLVGDAPYLNGGLFEKEADDERWFFPDNLIGRIFNELFYAYNFTITESTPLDIEVAVDPEMLGKIFEELVTGRHETGSYYTPKPVVAFMCREALKHYLHDACPVEPFTALEGFVENRDPASLHNPEGVLEALRQVKVCDPACGSGAYLLGMLHELLDLRAALFSARSLDARTIYDRKLEIIQNSLYGVDKDPFAVAIARLRLWLSLVVDDPRNPLQDTNLDVSLPNLDFKIESGDSLTAPDPSGGLELGFRANLVDDYLRAKESFLRAHGEDKPKKKAEVLRLKQELQTWAGREPKNDEFDWAVEFTEIFTQPIQPVKFQGGGMNDLLSQMATVMQRSVSTKPAPGGFDIVLANPPYVRADAQFKHVEEEVERQKQIDAWKQYRETLKGAKIYHTLHEKWDLYIPFLERAYQLLRTSGHMVFIIPDAYNTSKYAKKSHEFFITECQVERVDFCSEINLFDAGVNNTIVQFKKEKATSDSCPVRVRRWGKSKDEFDYNQQFLSTGQQLSVGSNLFRIDEGKKNSSSVNHLTLDMVCYISVGMVIHADEKKAQGLFKAEDLVSDIKDKQHPKPYVEGKDIIRWGIQRVRYLEYGTKRAPGMFRRPTFIELHESPERLLALRMCGNTPAVAYDSSNLFSNHTVILFVPWTSLKGVINGSIRKTSKYKHQAPDGDREIREKISRDYNIKYLLAIMNSSFAKRFLNKIRQSKTDIYPDEWKQLPIIPISMEEQSRFINLVDEIMSEYTKYGFPLPVQSARHVTQIEQEIDNMVDILYEGIKTED